ncbi:DUF6114 domain-containing protein [Actinokineospora globicatena]|uniref:DUF6114 domain-containing protein n=1 Tax=Actinokineospora globicatena TaxID=103729 RepID=UPI0020A4D8AF|nr:DUF6114 domain-containing protein [Actinokineospora globicatena]MCP2305539.1 hypothetical protein [Actinokineospora globicatena]GLW81407.1 hypothetical protein Aglo01_58880 [Actinokineospora globicatena]GLW87895.1 hypothetical protein Aglo02_55340 [Actinokineospora globicatena]
MAHGSARSSTALVRAGQAVGSGWRWFTDFRRTRPFWGGLWMVLGGWAIMSLTFAPIAVVLSAGFGGIAGYLLGGGLVLFGLCAWFAPKSRHLAGFLGVLFAVASLVGSNLGGFLVGMLLGILGGSMTFGWGPRRVKPEPVGEAA